MTSNNRKKRELSGMGANKHLIFLILDAAGFRNWRTNFWFFVDLFACLTSPASRGRPGELFNLHPMGKKVVLADKERSRKPSVRQICSNMSLRDVNPEVEGGYMDGNKEMCPPEFACPADKSQSRARVSAKLTLTGPGRRTQDAPKADLSARHLSAGRGPQMAGRRLLYSLRRWGECRKTHLLTSRRTLPVMRAGRVFAGRCQSTGGKTPFCSRPTWPRSMPSHCWTVRI